jgi:hypothetical protein
MKYIYGFTAAALAVVGVLGFHHQSKGRQLRITGGKTTLGVYQGFLDQGIRFEANATAEGDAASSEAPNGFAVDQSGLTFTLVDGKLTRFTGGEIVHKGGFKLSSGRNVIDATQFKLVTSDTVNDAIEFQLNGKGKEGQVFDLQHPRMYYLPKLKQLVVGSVDLVLNDRGARALGRPELTGRLIGMLNLYGDSTPIDGMGDVEIPPVDGGEQMPAAPIDVSLSAMGSLTSLGRLGTYPNGRNGLSMSTTSCNVGSNNIPWQAPMQVSHPVISMNMYRIYNGRFEQIGWSWLKHGFLATNSPGCGSCQNPGTGSLLGPGCSDTYGTGNNGDRFYLGGRDEVNPWTGVWTCQNSYFSNYVNDCVRRNTGSEFSGDPVAHRLEVYDSDLNVSGAQFFYEAYYINGNDFDHYNNIGSREATATWTGSSWSFNTTGAQIQGPAINRWGQMRDTAVPRTEGDVIVAVQTTNLGGGNWHYEIAVYNHDLDRQVREFVVPKMPGATVSNVGFRDVDKDGSNQWTMQVTNDRIKWSTGTFGSQGANPLKYSNTFNFWFDCNQAPVDGKVTLGLFKPGTGTQLTANSKVPPSLQPLNSFLFVNSVLVSGNLQSLNESDDDSLQVTPGDASSRSPSGIEGSLTAPSTNPASITVGVESRNTLGASANQVVLLYNWASQDWEQIDSRSATVSDSLITLNISSNASRFVNSSTREVKIRVLHAADPGANGSRWRIYFDLVGLQFG